jgi:ketosteroid isomerase-like protein
MSSDPIAVVLDFEGHINARNAAAIAACLTPDAELVDSLGSRIEGRERLRSAWEGYFRMVPDYRIAHDEIFCQGDTVVLCGSAQGTLAKDGTLPRENYWTTPAAWRVVVSQGKVRSWQVFADNEPIRAMLRRAAETKLQTESQ